MCLGGAWRKQRHSKPVTSDYKGSEPIISPQAWKRLGSWLEEIKP